MIPHWVRHYPVTTGWVTVMGALTTLSALGVWP